MAMAWWLLLALAPVTKPMGEECWKTIGPDSLLADATSRGDVGH